MLPLIVYLPNRSSYLNLNHVIEAFRRIDDGGERFIAVVTTEITADGSSQIFHLRGEDYQIFTDAYDACINHDWYEDAEPIPEKS